MSNNIHSNFQTQELISLSNFKDFKDCKSYLPDDVLTKIFAELGHLALSSTLCLVSQHWNVVASQDILWCSWTVALEISKEEINQGQNKQLTIGKIVRQRFLTKEAEPLLDKHVKTALEFDMASHEIMFKKNPSEEDKQFFNQLLEEVGEKLEISKKLKEGFRGNLLLRRIGLSNFDSMKKYAGKLQTSYGDDQAWQSIAFEYIRENQLEPVKEILNSSLKDNDSCWPIIDRIIGDFCRNDQLSEAIQFLETHLASFSPQQLLKYEHFSQLERTLESILSYAEKKKQFDIFENMVTKYICQKNQRRHLMNLVELLLKEKLSERARELIEKYSEEWEKDQDIFNFHRLIGIHVQIKNYKQALRLALKDCSEDEDNWLLKSLRRTFLDAGLLDQAKEVDERLSLKETSS